VKPGFEGVALGREPRTGTYSLSLALRVVHCADIRSGLRAEQPRRFIQATRCPGLPGIDGDGVEWLLTSSGQDHRIRIGATLQRQPGELVYRE